MPDPSEATARYEARMRAWDTRPRPTGTERERAVLRQGIADAKDLVLRSDDALAEIHVWIHEILDRHHPPEPAIYDDAREHTAGPSVDTLFDDLRGD